MRNKVAAFGFMLAEASVAHAHAHPVVPIDNIRAISATMPVSSADAYDQGKRLLAGGDLPGALAAFRQALSRAPGSIDALNGIAVSYDRLRRPDIARTYYEAALAIDPNSASLLNNLGYSLYLQGDRSAAIAPLRAAAAGTDPDIAAAARRTLALIAATPPSVITAIAEAAPENRVERTTEGEQRLVFNTGKSTDFATSVAKPWSARDDSALQSQVDSEVHVEVVALALVEHNIEAARLAQAVPVRTPFAPPSPGALAAAFGSALRPANDGPLIVVADSSAAPNRMGSSDGRQRLAMFGRRDAGLQTSVQRSDWQPGGASPRAAFDSDDAALNAFAARMSAGPTPVAAKADLRNFADMIRNA